MRPRAEGRVFSGPPSLMNPVHLKSIPELQAAFLDRNLSPLEVTQYYITQIEKSNLNAYITLCKDRALEQARNSEKLLAQEKSDALRQWPLLGVPIAVKDVLVTQGIRTTCASKMLENYVPPYTATAVKRLEKAGAILLGKLNMDEFAMGGSNENSAFGPVQHPTHPGYVPGGSSGGSATAVRAGLCHASLGTDTGGSIRLPASYCGVVGFKPSYGRISRYGMVAFASSLDQIGPITRCVKDTAILYGIMSGHDPLDSTSSLFESDGENGALEDTFRLDQLKIGVPDEYGIYDPSKSALQDDVANAIRKALAWLEKQGSQIVPLSLPLTKYSVAVYYLVAVSEASSNLARFDGVRFGSRSEAALKTKDLHTFYKSVRSQFGAEVKRRIMLGTYSLCKGYSQEFYHKACQVRKLIKEDFNRAFEKVDLILGPVSPTTAFRLGEKALDPLKMYLNDIMTIPANLAGLPALSLPCGMDSQNLPIGLHWMAPAFEDKKLLSAAHGFEDRYTFS